MAMGSMARLALCGIFLSLAVPGWAPGQTTPLNVVRITPEGDDAPESSQIIIEFDQAMSILGKQKPGDLPIKLSPATPGEWRWLNDKTLAFHHGEAGGFKKATTYTITVAAGFKALEGQSLAQDYQHTFTTTLPRFSWAYQNDWLSPTRPQFSVEFNQAIKKQSLIKHAYFAAVNDPSSRVAVIATSRAFDENNEIQKDLDTTPFWDVFPAEELQAAREFELRLEPGIEAEEGPALSKDAQVIKSTKTFGKFELLGFRCFTNAQGPGEEPLTFNAENPQGADQACNPMARIDLVFSAPILRSQLAKHIQITPDPTGKKDSSIWQVPDNESRSLTWAEGGATPYPQYVPPGLKAATVYTFALPSPDRSWWQKIIYFILSFFKPQAQTALEDEFGRTLDQPFSVAIRLDDRKPNFVLPSATVVLEKQADSDAPLYVNNLKKVELNFHALTAKGSSGPQTLAYDFPFVKNIQFAIPGRIREALAGQSGALYGTLTTEPETHGESDEGKPKLFAQVTPFQVQVKLGHFQSLVWVTDLASGEVVRDAKVTIYPGILSRLDHRGKDLATAVTDERGLAMLPGLESIDPSKTRLYEWKADKETLFVRVEKNDDMALLFLRDPFAISMYQASGYSFGAWNQTKYEHMTAWGMTAQGVYRVGDQIDYKLYLRNQSNTHLVAAPPAQYDLSIVDPLGKVVHEVKGLKLDRVGSYSGTFTTSKAAAVGWYSFEIKAYMADLPKHASGGEEAKKNPRLEPTVKLFPMRVLVSDFTPSPFKVDTEVNGERFEAEQEVIATTSAKLHAGGAYPDARAEITAALKGAVFSSSHPLASKFSFAPGEALGESILFKEQGTLDGKGEFQVKHQIPVQASFYGNLIFEGKVYDDRGSSVTSRRVVPYLGGERLVGLKQKEWLLTSKKPAEIALIVVDPSGEPVAGKANIKVERQETTVAKVKGAGNVYQSHTNQTWVEVSAQNDLAVDPKGAVYTYTPPQAGSYKITATTSDTQGRSHTSVFDTYATGEGFVVWGDENDTYLPLLPEKSEYKVGETVRLLVKNPYAKATALVTVERFGTMQSFVQTLSGNAPVIEIPVQADFTPNFYVSVTAMAPRADQAPLTVGQVDLGKPSFRMGYAKINVKDHYKELVVKVEAERDTYKPRDEVRVSLQAALKHPLAAGQTPEPINLAVAVVDEAVFALNPEGRSYYDPYQGFYREEGLDMSNYSLLNALVGRMKFERKGATAGGDGGVDPSIRNLFKFVSYWNPDVALDAQGRAKISFKAPDNLTGWRVLAMAVTPSDKMGLGDGNFKVNRPTEIRPVMPNQVSAGDQFKAGFSVMNRTQETRQIKVEITASGTLDKVEKEGSLRYEKLLTIEPFKRQSLDMPITAGEATAKAASIRFTVRAGDELDRDQTVHNLPVLSRKVIESQAVAGSFVNDELQVPVAIPADSRGDTGGLTLSLAPTVISQLAGAFKYMQDYPYSCWEQKLSRALVAASYPALAKYIGQELSWPDSRAFTDAIIQEAGSFQADNGGMAYFLGMDPYVDPFLSAYTALGFAWLRRQGYAVPTAVESKLLAYLELLLRKGFTESYYSPGMVAGTRAVILEALANYQKLSLVDLERLAPDLAKMSLHGQASFTRAAVLTKGGSPLAQSTMTKVLGHFNETATTLSRAGSGGELATRMLDSSVRDSCSVLEALVLLGKTTEGQALASDRAVKLAQHVIAVRKTKAFWDNTQDNMQCTRALVAYAEAYESQAPQMQVSVSKDEAKLGDGSFKAFDAPALVFTAPMQPSDPGKTTALQLKKTGSGRLYYKALLQFAPQKPDPNAVNAGLAVRREYSVLRDKAWVLLDKGVTLQRGDLVRADLFVTTSGERTFVVVDDPIPGGLEPVNKDFATASALDQEALTSMPPAGSHWHTFKDWIEFDAGRWSFYHQELRHDAVRFYADFLTGGSYHLSYLAQVVSEGAFTVPAVMAAEMYNPETYGRGTVGQLTIGQP